MTVATLSPSRVVTDTTGANCSAFAIPERLSTSMINEKTNVARNRPKVTRVRRERMKMRTVLGEYWLAASWMATRVVAKTTATNARVAAAMAAAKLEAAPWSGTRSGRKATGAATTESSQRARFAKAIDAAMNIVGINQSDTRTRWLKSTRQIGIGWTGSAFMGREPLKCFRWWRTPEVSISVHGLAYFTARVGTGRLLCRAVGAGRHGQPRHIAGVHTGNAG